jgi:hypothetical protein
MSIGLHSERPIRVRDDLLYLHTEDLPHRRSATPKICHTEDLQNLRVHKIGREDITQQRAINWTSELVRIHLAGGRVVG